MDRDQFYFPKYLDTKIVLLHVQLLSMHMFKMRSVAQLRLIKWLFMLHLSELTALRLEGTINQFIC